MNNVDLVISSAGIANECDAVAKDPFHSLIEHFRVNAGGPLLLLQESRSLLQTAASPAPKFVVLDRAIASLADTGLSPLCRRLRCIENCSKLY